MLLAAAILLALTLTPFTVNVVISLAIPVLTAVGVAVFKTNTKAAGVISLFLSFGGGLIATATQSDGSAVLSQALVQNAVLIFLIQLAQYVGFYKKRGINEKVATALGR